ncbi:hypothetical protein LCGC14_1775990 [marine sediment metagenome]|uniref:Uncharacterized protein n=1 Tax=marine sediment metagenome TaxID=412755 RepID=A0A0F9JBU2_9ZZZZ
MMKYACERCNQLQSNLDSMFTVCIGISKYVDELEEQRRILKAQLSNYIGKDLNLKLKKEK